MKKIFALLLCFLSVLPLIACSGGGALEDSDFVDETPAVQKYQNRFIACDQKNSRVVVYDLDRLTPGDDLEKGVVWTREVSSATAGVKYREGTVFGNVVLTAGSKVQMFSYPAGDLLWECSNPGSNPHSVEILPSGNIVVASSDGAQVRLFYTSAFLSGGSEKDSKKYTEVTLYSAHGVLWDPEYDVLWALGGSELAAYAVVGEGTSQRLVKDEDLSYTLPYGGGHDLAADLSDTRYLYATVQDRVIRYDKEEKKGTYLFPNSEHLSRSTVKGFGNNLNGNFIYCYPDGKCAREWQTKSITYCYLNKDGEMVKKTYTSSKAAFYKVRILYGKYQ